MARSTCTIVAFWFRLFMASTRRTMFSSKRAIWSLKSATKSTVASSAEWPRAASSRTKSMAVATIFVFWWSRALAASMRFFSAGGILSRKRATVLMANPSASEMPDRMANDMAWLLALARMSSMKKKEKGKVRGKSEERKGK